MIRRPLGTTQNWVFSHVKLVFFSATLPCCNRSLIRSKRYFTGTPYTKTRTTIIMPKRPRNSKKKNAGKDFAPKKRKTKEIVFDPDARRDYLRGFSERKKQRRAYGLAMQKVKDRKEKLESRKDRRLGMLEQVEEAEKQKEAMRLALLAQQEKNNQQEEDSESEIEDSKKAPIENDENSESEKDDKITTTAYDDQVTQDQWGGNVIVTTSTKIPGEDSDDESESQIQITRKPKKRAVDEAQQYAGNVDKFMNQLKGNMPSKKKANHKTPRGGKHGATGMKGMGAGDIKIAQKALAKSKAKSGKTRIRKGGRNYQLESIIKTDTNPSLLHFLPRRRNPRPRPQILHLHRLY